MNLVPVDLGSACVSPGAPGPPCQLLCPYGEESVANGVAVDLQSGLLERLVRAEEVTGTALGFPIMLSSGDTAALAELAGTVHEGKAPPE